MLQNLINYTSLADRKIIDVLFHVVNHSTYHRAQVAFQFRLNGINPSVTDYIMLKREGLL